MSTSVDDAARTAALARKAAHLNDTPLTDDAIAEATSHYARPRADADRATSSALVFRIGGEWLALPTEVFDEVAPESPVHTLPHRRGRSRSGLVGVRGEIIVHVSLADLLEIDANDQPTAGARNTARASTRNAARLLVASSPEGRLAFTVNEIGGVKQYDPSELRAPPSTLERAKTTYTQAMLEHDGRMVGLLDATRVFGALSSSLA